VGIVYFVCLRSTSCDVGRAVCGTGVTREECHTILRTLVYRPQIIKVHGKQACAALKYLRGARTVKWFENV